MNSIVKLAVVIVAFQFVSLSTFASGDPNFVIQCDSINHSAADGDTAPLPPDEKLYFEVSGLVGQSNAVMKLTKTKSGVAVDIETIPVTFSAWKTDSNVVQASWYIGEKARVSGVFTIDGVLWPNTKPFIAYGWSTNPVTSRSAMEYRCELFSSGF